MPCCVADIFIVHGFVVNNAVLLCGFKQTKGKRHENSDSFDRTAAGISGCVSFNSLWPLVAGGGGMSDFWKDYEPESTRAAPVTKDELTEPLGCVVVRPLVSNSTTPPAAPVQEPVASAAYDMVDRFLRNNLSSDADYAEYSAALDAIYTTPPAAQRQWVGLTTEEMATCIDEPSWDLILRKAEQILKEKNA